MALNIKIGADPELFAFKNKEPISVHDLLPGTKYEPMEVPRGAIQVDGVAAEFNITPATTKKEFIKNLMHVKSLMERILISKDKEIRLYAIPTVMFEESYFNNLPTEAKALGCEPDYNAYTRDKNPKPETTRPMRTGSGHIHIGWDGCDQDSPGYMDNCFKLVTELDFVLYRQSAAWDSDQERMELYGKPGAFRFKPYGLEYRVLSNRWLNSEKTMAFVYDAARNVTARFLKGETFAEHLKEGENYEDYLKLRRLPIINEYLHAA